MVNYCLVSNLPFLGKVIERAVAEQLQASLDNTCALDPFQPGWMRTYYVTNSSAGFSGLSPSDYQQRPWLFAVLTGFSWCLWHSRPCFLVEVFAGRCRYQGVWSGLVLIIPYRIKGIPLETSSQQSWICSWGSTRCSLILHAIQSLGELICSPGIECHQYADNTLL